MKQAIIGLALVAVGMCAITTKRSATDDYYNKGSKIMGEELTEMGGSLTNVGKKLGGTPHNKIGVKKSSLNPLR